MPEADSGSTAQQSKIFTITNPKNRQKKKTTYVGVQQLVA